MANTSATGGFLLSSKPELNDDGLMDFLQPWFVGLTGLDDDKVIILYQEDPPPQPGNSVTWLSIGLSSERQRDWDAYVAHVAGSTGVAGQDDEPGYDLLYRNEVLRVRCVAYGPNSDAVSAAVWNNTRIGQNREYLSTQGMALIEVGDSRPVPEKIKQKWVRRVDFEVRLRRAVSLRYPVLDVAGAVVELSTDTPATIQTVTVEGPIFDEEGFGEAPFGI